MRPVLRRLHTSPKGADDGAGVCASGNDTSADAATQVTSQVRMAVYLMWIVIAIIRRLLILGLVGAAAWAAYRYTSQPATEIVLTGIVTTDEIVVSPQIGGRIEQLLVKEGDVVTRDQLLAVMVPDELKDERDFYTYSAEGRSRRWSKARPRCAARSG